MTIKIGRLWNSSPLPNLSVRRLFWEYDSSISEREWLIRNWNFGSINQHWTYLTSLSKTVILKQFNSIYFVFRCVYYRFTNEWCFRAPVSEKIRACPPSYYSLCAKSRVMSSISLAALAVSWVHLRDWKLCLSGVFRFKYLSAPPPRFCLS